MDRFDNTVQYAWFLDIARTFLGFQGDRLSAADADSLFDEAERCMARTDWEEHVWKLSNLEAVFLTNEFDDPLEGFDTRRYVPCLRTDDLVFKLDQPSVRQRLARATGIEVGDPVSLRRAITSRFEHFTRKGAKACAICLPPDFAPVPVSEGELATALRANDGAATRSQGVFWMLAEHCREFGLPFDLMIGVNRRVYREGVYQGQDLFDPRTSLIQYAELFNAFPEVPFCISVLSSGQNQELVSYQLDLPERDHQRALVVLQHPRLHRGRPARPAAGGAEDQADRLLQRHVQAGVRPAEVQHVSPTAREGAGRRFRPRQGNQRTAGHRSGPLYSARERSADISCLVLSANPWEAIHRSAGRSSR